MGKLKVGGMSLKKKIFIGLIVIGLIVGAVFLVLKFAFPDADPNEPYNLAFQVGADTDGENKVFEALDAFYADGILNAFSLKIQYPYFFDKISTKTVTKTGESYLLCLSDIQDVDNLNKKNKQLKKIKEEVDSSKSVLFNYYDSQVKPYMSGSTKTAEMTAQYFGEYAKKFVQYLQSVQNMNKYLFTIISSSSKTNSYVNGLTLLLMDFNNQYLDSCMRVLTDKYINKLEEVDSGVLASYVMPKEDMFVLKTTAVSTYLSDVSVYDETIKIIKGYTWTSDWLKVFRTAKEVEYLNNLTAEQKAEYNNLKSFIETFFDTRNLLGVA